MINPVLRSIKRERKVAYGILGDIIIKLEEETEASMGNHDVGRHGINVIEGKRSSAN